MKLYELNKAIADLLEQANPETGEIDETAFTALSIAKEEKQKNIILFVNHLSSDSEAIEKEIERLEDMKRKTENAKKWLTEYLKRSMEQDSVSELDFTTFKAKIKKNPPKLALEDPAKIPDKFWKLVSKQELDKEAVKEAIKQGEEIKGAKIVQTTRLEIK